MSKSYSMNAASRPITLRFTVWRWVQRYGPELEQRLRRHLKPTNKSWRVDETYIRVKGRWCYFYRAIDSTGATIDFLLSALRDGAAAKRLFRKALSGPSPFSKLQHFRPDSGTIGCRSPCLPRSPANHPALSRGTNAPPPPTRCPAHTAG